MKRIVLVLLGICLFVGGCSSGDSEDKKAQESSTETKIEKKTASSEKAKKKVAMPLSLGADENGELPKENGDYTPYLFVEVPETYGCLMYNTLFSEVNDSGETVAEVYYTQGRPNVKGWMEEDEKSRYAGMPYNYVFCLNENKRSSWFSYTLIDEDNLKRMQEKYPTSDFDQYAPLNMEKKAIEMTIEEDASKYTVLKKDKGEEQAAGFTYTYDYFLAEDDDKDRGIYCDYTFNVGDGTVLYYSLKGYESEMKISDFNPKQHGKEIAESIKIE